MVDSIEYTSDASARQRRLRFELIFASVWLAVGLFVVPALIYWVGITMLGPYGEGTGASVGAFYADFFGDLASGEIRTWVLALGPLVLVSVLRAIFVGPRSAQPPEAPEAALAAPQEPAPRQSDHQRVEPRVGD